MREHLASLDLEAFAELDVGTIDDFPELGFPLDQRQLSESAAIQVEQIKDHQHNAR